MMNFKELVEKIQDSCYTEPLLPALSAYWEEDSVKTTARAGIFVICLWIQ